jgi:hypothetical protein
MLQSESAENCKEKLAVADASRQHRRLELEQLRLGREFGQADLPLPPRARLSHPHHAELGFFLPQLYFQDRSYAHGIAHSGRHQTGAANVPYVGWLSKRLRERINSPQLHR